MSPLDVTIHVNRGSTDAVLETDVDSVETCEPIELVLCGHETPAHVHCRLDERLDRIASIPQSNYYVEPDDVTPVPIDVDVDDIDDPVRGTLEIVGGYGAESVSIDVIITPGPPQVDVDDSLADPTRSDPEPTPIERAVTGVSALIDIELGTIAVVALGLVAIAIATATAASIGGPVAFGGLAIVVTGVGVGLGLLLR